MRRLALALALFPGLAVLSGLVLAQEPAEEASTQEAPASDELYFEHVAVDVVNVEVYVTDKSGEPILGLTAEDFEITEDGRPVEIVNFYSVAGGRPEQSLRVVEEESGVPDAAQKLPRLGVDEVVVPESQRLHVIIYVDNFNIHPLNRNRAFGRLRTFLSENLDPGDRAMVVSYDRSLRIRQPFTESTETVNRVLLEIEEISAMGQEREFEREDALRKIFETTSLHTAEFEAKQFSDNQYHEMDNALDGLREMIDSLGGMPGRKMVIHLSDGIPMVPGQDLYQAIQQRFAGEVAILGEAFSRDLSRRYLEIVSHANSNRISFYMIDAGGLRTRSWMAAEHRTINTQTPVGMAVDGTRNSNLQGTLRLMANRTGGQAILNTNDIRAGLERIAVDFDNYYSLGYSAPLTQRGRYHKIEVRLKDGNPDWTLRYREGYRDKSLSAKIEDGTRAFLVHGHESNPLNVSIDLGQPSAEDDGTASLPIRIRVPMAQVVLLPRGEFYEGRLRFYFAAVDENGRDAPLQELEYELRIPRASLERAQADEVAQVITATMRTGPHKVVVVVLDEFSEERSVVGRFVTIQSPRQG